MEALDFQEGDRIFPNRFQVLCVSLTEDGVAEQSSTDPVWVGNRFMSFGEYPLPLLHWKSPLGT